MAAIDTSRPFAASGSAGRFAGVFVGFIAAFKTWNDARMTRRHLTGLSDRELQDIGLTRFDIDGVVARL
ncbi:MAG: DUF1127 domain-containing protein [Pelagimonas sp.]|jgi:uncharacterized protein YjiS (DUF1127 family)|nr:DUF1127 domain-containing protein [Pelagimonas sp.]